MFFFIGYLSIKTIVKLKKSVINIGIFCIIVNKFYHKKKLCLIVLFIIDKGLEIGLHYIIISFDLVIYFGVESSKESLLNLKKIT